MRGEYKLDGTPYTVTVTHAGPRTANLVGQTFTYRVTVTGDTYSRLGGQWSETWRRAPPAKYPLHWRSCSWSGSQAR